MVAVRRGIISIAPVAEPAYFCQHPCGSSLMKTKDAKKETKKAPTKTMKEKKLAKAEKKKARD
jgi:hypothetical protein